MMKYSECMNPYDFAYPVNDPKLFIGRKKEADDVRYYLNQAKLVKHPINIALLGRRSAGKTSFLNIIENEAKQLNYCVVRINLDEGDSITQLAFFYKLFDALFTTVCEMGAFGGINNKTYDIYTDMVSGCNIPEDKTFCPFLFPIQFSKSICNNNMDAQLSDNAFKRDLLIIAKEINSPIVLLFDECNVLANSRIHLQKLRNIFMDLPRYMLIFAGTPDLFPMMDDVFSPIIRQFKKIHIGAFEDQEETEDCIKIPLQQIGINNIDEIFDMRAYKEIKEIHNLSGGYPYEIQLICHMMFKRVQQCKSQKMILDLNVLEEVRRELESSQELTKRPILIKIRNLSKEKLSALSKLCEGNIITTLEQVWYMEYLINGESKWTKKSLENELEYFISEGLIIKNKEDIIIFAGDDFDKIYTKYYAREHDILIRFFEGGFEGLWSKKINEFITKKSGVRVINDLNLESTLDECIDKICSPVDKEDVFLNNSKLYLKLYNIFINSKRNPYISFIEIDFNLKWAKFNMFYYLESATENNKLEDLTNILFELKSRSSEVGDTIEIKNIKMASCSSELLKEKVMRSSNIDLKKKLCGNHYFDAVVQYITENGKSAAFFAKLAIVYSEEEYTDSNFCNNLAYILLGENELEDAIKLFKIGISICDDESSLALLNFNLGIAEAKKNNLDSAVMHLDRCISLCEKIQDVILDCLLVPEIREEILLFCEVKNPHLIEASIKSLEIIKNYMKDWNK